MSYFAQIDVVQWWYRSGIS